LDQVRYALGQVVCDELASVGILVGSPPFPRPITTAYILQGPAFQRRKSKGELLPSSIKAEAVDAVRCDLQVPTHNAGEIGRRLVEK
jgi:hypothetical protein